MTTVAQLYEQRQRRRAEEYQAAVIATARGQDVDAEHVLVVLESLQRTPDDLHRDAGRLRRRLSLAGLRDSRPDAQRRLESADVAIAAEAARFEALRQQHL